MSAHASFPVPAPSPLSAASAKEPFAGADRRPGRLKICYISETVHAGVGRHLVDAMSHLARRGHELHLLYSPIRADPQFVAALRALPNTVCEEIPMPRSIGIGDIGAFRRIRRYVRANGPFDIIHGQSSKGGGYARLLALSAPGAIFYTPHAFVTLSPTLRRAHRLIYGSIETALSWLTDCVVCVSSTERDHAGRLGIAARRIGVIIIGADAAPVPPRAEIRAASSFAPDQIVVGYVGRMDDQKAPERLVEVAERLLPSHPEISVVMVGEGPKLATLRARTDAAGLQGRIEWRGFDDARYQMANFDILVVPSFYEGFARVLLEGLFTGLPIVSTPIGGADEAIEDGVNGFLVRHGDTDQMAAAIERLAGDASLRRAMSRASRERAQWFTIERMVDGIEALYQTMRHKHRAPAMAPASMPAAVGAQQSEGPY
jgi:glycosyltransferase involved in cell wall biosynthesis